MDIVEAVVVGAEVDSIAGVSSASASKVKCKKNKDGQCDNIVDGQNPAPVDR